MMKLEELMAGKDSDWQEHVLKWWIFYDQKNEIPMKIPELKRSGIGIIVESHRIPTGFPNQDSSW